MKRILTGVSSAAVLVFALSTARADLIGDGGFEGTGQGPWGGWIGAMTRDFDSVAEQHGGAESMMVTWSESVPEWDSAVAAQSFAVTAGSDWYVHAFARVTVPLDNAFAYLETVFRDAGDAEVGKQQSAWIGSETTDWTMLSNSGTVSNGAVSASVQLVAVPWAGGSSSGTVFWDDVSTDAIPEPTALALMTFACALAGIARRRVKS